MTQRPLSISIIGWFLIVTGCLSSISTLISINNPMVQELMAQTPIPVPVQYVMSAAGLFVMILCGTMFLKGQHWARLLYVIWSLVGFVIALITSPMKLMLIPGLMFYLIIVFFLFRPKANAFFSGEEVAVVAESD